MFDSSLSLPVSTDLRALLVLWPCGGGDAMQYALDEAALHAAGIGLLRFNPGGHGRSPGPFTFEGSIDGLARAVEAAPAVPRIGVGHSMGTYGLLRAQGRVGLQHLIGVSPIGASRRSLAYMYEIGRFGAFLRLFAADEARLAVLKDAIGTPEWLADDATFVERTQRLEFPCEGVFHVPSVAAFMREVFLPGYTIWPWMGAMRGRMSVVLPTEDRWYPLPELRVQLAEREVPVTTFAPAGDHLFTGAWPLLTHWLVDEIRRVGLA
jgi:hypothetical protein